MIIFYLIQILDPFVTWNKSSCVCLKFKISSILIKRNLNNSHYTGRSVTKSAKLLAYLDCHSKKKKVFIYIIDRFNFVSSYGLKCQCIRDVTEHSVEKEREREISRNNIYDTYKLENLPLYLDMSLIHSLTISFRPESTFRLLARTFRSTRKQSERLIRQSRENRIIPIEIPIQIVL